MTTGLLAASASWYISRICSVIEPGFLCFGASNALFVFDVSGGLPVYISHWAAHKHRVTSVALCRQEDKVLCCSSGEDGKIRVHDMHSAKLLYEHSKHKVSHDNAIQACTPNI